MPFSGMLHSPFSCEIYKPLLAGISRCVQEIPALLANSVRAPITWYHAADAMHSSGYCYRIPEHDLFWTGTYGSIAARSQYPACANRGEAKGHAPVATML